MSFNGYTINMNTFQLPCSSTFDFMARMGVVHAADNFFAGVGGIKSPKKQDILFSLKLVHYMFHLDLVSVSKRLRCSIIPPFPLLYTQAVK